MFFARFFIKDSKNYTNSVVRNNYGKFSSIVSIIFNIVLFAFKLIAGVISGSVGIMADAFNNLSDASSSIISFVGFSSLANQLIASIHMVMVDMVFISAYGCRSGMRYWHRIVLQ